MFNHQRTSCAQSEAVVDGPTLCLWVMSTRRRRELRENSVIIAPICWWSLRLKRQTRPIFKTKTIILCLTMIIVNYYNNILITLLQTTIWVLITFRPVVVRACTRILGNFIAYIYLIIIIMVGTMSDVRTTSDVPMYLCSCYDVDCGESVQPALR